MSLKDATSVTDCKDETESLDILEDMYVEITIQTNFWNSKNFLRNGKEMNSQFVHNEVQLNSVVFQRQAFSLQENAITFRNNRWINVPYMPKLDPGTKYKAYDVSSAFNTIYPLTKDRKPSDASAVNPQDTYFSMHFTQHTKTVSTSSTREAVSNTFQRFGSYLALCLRFIGYVLGAYQRFSLDNSMTKKLYNYVEKEEHEEEHDDALNPPDDKNQFQANLKNEVKQRKHFDYTLWRFCWKKNLSSAWCFCCRQQNDYKDDLQSKARTQLYSELDIMQIIHKLRIAKFVAEQNLSEEQRYLVNYHTEYMLFRDKKKAKPFNASRYTDHRSEEKPDENRDERIRFNVKTCIESLDPSDEQFKDSYKATYKAIMGRGRPLND